MVITFSVDEAFGTPFNNLNIDLVPYVQNSAIFIGKSDNFSDTRYANASGKYIRLSAWYSICKKHLGLLEFIKGENKMA